MAENKCKDTEHALDVYVEIVDRNDEPGQALKYPLQHLKSKNSLSKKS